MAWRTALLYWVHQFEEYSLPALGFDNYVFQQTICVVFQQTICVNVGYPAYPNCPIPLAFFPLVNIMLMWVGAPLAAYLGRRNVIIGLSFWGLALLNGLLHVTVTIVTGAYNPGMLTGLMPLLRPKSRGGAK